MYPHNWKRKSLRCDNFNHNIINNLYEVVNVIINAVFD